MNSGTDVKGKSTVYLNMDMLGIEDVVVLIWGAMVLEDAQVSIAWNMAEELAEAGGESGVVSEDRFFEIIEPFMKEIAVIDDHLADFGRNRVLAVLYQGLIVQMAEDLGNDKLLTAAKARYPEFDWEFQPPWEVPNKEPEQFFWPEWLM